MTSTGNAVVMEPEGRNEPKTDAIERLEALADTLDSEATYSQINGGVHAVVRIADLRETAEYLRLVLATLREQREALADPNVVHINMLRGGIAKPTPAQIGHLYRGEEAVAVVAEVMRQNPDAFAPSKPGGEAMREAAEIGSLK